MSNKESHTDVTLQVSLVKVNVELKSKPSLVYGKIDEAASNRLWQAVKAPFNTIVLSRLGGKLIVGSWTSSPPGHQGGETHFQSPHPEHKILSGFRPQPHTVLPVHTTVWPGPGPTPSPSLLMTQWWWA